MNCYSVRIRKLYKVNALSISTSKVPSKPSQKISGGYFVSLLYRYAPHNDVSFNDGPHIRQ